MRLLTVGHGTQTKEQLAVLLQKCGIEHLVDVRIAPGSKRHPHFGRAELEEWLPAAGIEYRWEGGLGGFRRPRPDSPNTALRNSSFRGYADYMQTEPFSRALEQLIAEASEASLTVMCAESLWWRCHRRMIADASVLLCEAEVHHIGHDGRLSPHKLTDGARVDEGGGIVYAPKGTSQQPRLLEIDDQ